MTCRHDVKNFNSTYPTTFVYVFDGPKDDVTISINVGIVQSEREGYLRDPKARRSLKRLDVFCCCCCCSDGIIGPVPGIHDHLSCFLLFLH